MWNIKGLAVGLTTALLTASLLLPVISTPAEAQARFRTGHPAPESGPDYGAQFNALINALREKYVNSDKIPSDQELFDIAMKAIFERIGDRHGAFFNAEAAEQFKDSINPTNYSGVGIAIAPTPTGVVILEVFDNSPLNMMGVKAGDVITKASSSGGTTAEWDSTRATNDLRGMVMDMVAAIKGPRGTDVNLTVKRGSTELGVITVQRVETRQQYVYMKLKEETGVLTIRITSFSNTIRDDLTTMLEVNGWMDGDKLNTDIIKGVTFDFRSNPGGSLPSAAHTVDTWSPSGVNAVRIIQPPNEESDGRPVAIDFPTQRDRLFPNTIPRVMLVNGTSASASEIAAGAAQVHKEMPVFGTKTFGKGSVQSIIDLPGGTAMKTTTAIYLAGGTKEIDGVGIIPDSLVQQPDAPGSNNIDKRINGNIIRTSMDPAIDYQLAVAHKYLELLISGVHSRASDTSHQAAINKAHGAEKPVMIKAFCEQYGLRGCPVTANPPTVMGTVVPG